MNQLMSTVGQLTHEIVNEFVKHAESEGVEIPQEIVDSFFAEMKLPTGKGKGSRGPSRNPSSSFLLYRQDKKDEIEFAITDSGRRMEILENFIDGEHADKVTALQEFGEAYDTESGDDKPSIGAQHMVRMASLLWNLETPETREQYKNRAREENEQFQQANPSLAAGTTRRKTSRSPAKEESLENFKHVDYIKYTTDPEYDSAGCGAWLNRGHKYCTRRKKADSDAPMCKGHMKSYEEAMDLYPTED